MAYFKKKLCISHFGLQVVWNSAYLCSMCLLILDAGWKYDLPPPPPPHLELSFSW